MATNYKELFKQELLASQQQQDPTYKALEEQIMRPSNGASIAPTLGLVDHFTGSNFAAQAPKQESTKDKLMQLLQLKQGQQSSKLSGLGKLAQWQNADEEKNYDRAFKEKMFGLQSAAAKAKMAKALTPKLGSEDKQKLGFTTTLLKELPKLRALYEQDAGVIRPGMAQIFGQNELEQVANALAENYGRLQSGGAISKDEEGRFLSRLGSMMDSKEIRLAKLKQIEEEIMDKHGIYGGGSVASSARMPSGGRGAGKIDLRSLDLSNMTDEEIMALPEEF